MKKCPFCAEEIQDAAIRCKHCGSNFDPPSTSARPINWSTTAPTSAERHLGKKAGNSGAPRVLVAIAIIGSVVLGAMALGPLLSSPGTILGLWFCVLFLLWFTLAFAMKGSSASMRWGGGLLIALMVNAIGPGIGMLIKVNVLGGDQSSSALLTSRSRSASSTTLAPAAISAVATAADLMRAYTDNEVAADQRFKDKWIEVSGDIDQIGKDILDTPFVTFAIGRRGIWSVQAMFTRGKDEGVVAEFSKGQQLTLRCRGGGKLGNVFLRNCVVASKTLQESPRPGAIARCENGVYVFAPSDPAKMCGGARDIAEWFKR